MGGRVEQPSDQVIAFATHLECFASLGRPILIDSRNIDFFWEDAEVADQRTGTSKALDIDDLGNQRGFSLRTDAANGSETSVWPIRKVFNCVLYDFPNVSLILSLSHNGLDLLLDEQFGCLVL